MATQDDAAARHALLLALSEVLTPSLNGASSHRLAECIERTDLEADLMASVLDDDDRIWLAAGINEVRASRVEHWSSELLRLSERGVWMVDSADAAYPANLRMIHNRPPFLMVNGSLMPQDERAVAVVGARMASDEGRTAGYEIARQLAEQDVTVVSGLAEGIDTAAHSGALSAGGRTIAVFGTGIDIVFPAKNRALSQAVSRSGACVSQFLPSQRGARWTFPVRNLVTSGLSLGTVVVEASESSGARLQAEAALRHGKRVFLLAELVRRQPWAKAIAGQPNVVSVDSVDQILHALEIELSDSAVLV